MAKRNLGRVQGASLFFYNGNASSLIINCSALMPGELTPLIGDTVLDATGSLYTITSVTTQQVVLVLDVELSISGSGLGSDNTLATNNEIIALFDNIYSLAVEADINNLFD